MCTKGNISFIKEGENMGNKLRNIFISILAILVLVLTFNLQNVKAATNYTSSDMITEAKIVNQDKTYTVGGTVPLTYEFDSTGHQLKNNDTLTIDVPSPLSITSGSQFDVTDDNGQVIGTAVLSDNNQIIVTFNENVEELESVQGTLSINTGVNVDRKAQIGTNNVDFPVKDNQTQTSILKTKTNDKNISKKGVLGKDSQGNDIVTWTILVNRNELDFGNLTVSDQITDTNLAYVPGSVVVQEANWIDKDAGTYKRGNTVSADKYSLTETGSGFDLAIPKSGKQMYAIVFQTKVTDPDKLTDGTVFRNDASMTGSFSGNNGNGTQIIEDSASGKVSNETNSGNGSGTKLGSVVLTKNDEQNNNVLEGAIYDLYKVGSTTPLQTGLTTDTNGQIKVSSLSAGDYYFKETKAPSGYQLNENEIPFTITGQTTTPIKVNGVDEPEKEELGSIVIRKIDAETGYKLAGAEFNIVNDQGVVVGTITTDRLGIGHYYNLPIGHYKLVETKAPQGYLKGQDVEFDVTSNNLTPELISVENEKEVTGEDSYSIVLQKFDTDDMTLGVPGAEYTLYTTDGTALMSGITNELGVIRIDNLKPGNYYFQETKAPQGYDLNPDKILFTIKENDNEAGVGTLITSDPQTKSEPGDNNNGNEIDPSEPGDTDEGNSEEPNTEKPNVEEPDDNNGGLIVDPEHPTANNDDDDQIGLIPNPTNPDSTTNNSGANNEKLPQTGNNSNLLASLLGLVILISIVYHKQRQV